MDDAHDYYFTLDVPRSASDAEIRRAFRALAKEHHPDSRASGRSGSADRDFRQITEAYETLKDSSRRAAYDRELDETRQLETQGWRPGKRSFALGLGVGILSAIVAVGAVNYIGGAKRVVAEKAQDSLKSAQGSEKPVDGRRLSRERTRQQEAEADPPLSKLGKAPSSAPAQSGLPAPSPIEVSSTLPAESQAPSASPAGDGKPSDKSFQNAVPAPAERSDHRRASPRRPMTCPGPGRWWRRRAAPG